LFEDVIRDQPVTVAPVAALTRRRAVFVALVIASMAGLTGLLAYALSAGGFGLLDFVLVALFAVTLPWSLIGFWNGVIGFLIMRFARDPVAFVMPSVMELRGDEVVTASIAILICVRNESPDRVGRHLETLLQGLCGQGVAERFHVYVLSDTDDAAVAQAEDICFAALMQKWLDQIDIRFRRRKLNAGFKAGNIRDFCERWGGAHDFALVLDADSVMSAKAVLRLVRMMQANPRLGILQSLVVGVPAISAFTRLFQSGMRLGMRSYTIGSAWWQGDCGPYWGHNAILRLKPFIAHCALPLLPERSRLGRHVLSHDQIEAVLMRRAGYEVCVLPEEDGSFEQNPPTLIEFMRRDLRWCQGNMQYWRFLFMPGFALIGRCQLALAMLMFVSSPAWIGLLLFGTAAVALAGSGEAFIDPAAGWALLAIVLAMWFAPKLATLLDVLSRPGRRRAAGGARLILAGMATETIFSLLLSPIMWLAHTIFFGRILVLGTTGWPGQVREDHDIPWPIAAEQLWPHTLLGVIAIAVLAATVPTAIPYALLIAGGPLVAIPLAVVTAMPEVGRTLVRLGIGRLPEEIAPPPELRALMPPALDVPVASHLRAIS